MARAASALDLPLHANLGIMAQCRRRLLRQAHKSAPQTRCFDPSPTLRTPSTTSSPRPMPTPNPSCGPHAHTASSPLDLPLNFHPAAIRASAVDTPFGAV